MGVVRGVVCGGRFDYVGVVLVMVSVYENGY